MYCVYWRVIDQLGKIYEIEKWGKNCSWLCKVSLKNKPVIPTEKVEKQSRRLFIPHILFTFVFRTDKNQFVSLVYFNGKSFLFFPYIRRTFWAFSRFFRYEIIISANFMVFFPPHFYQSLNLNLIFFSTSTRVGSFDTLWSSIHLIAIACKPN